jgi:type IX secretion system PorP/SprF family membrane protein
MNRLLVLITFLISNPVFSQVLEYTQNFSYWMEGRSLINPACSGEEGSPSFQVSYAGYSGLRSNIRTMYAGGFIQLKSEKDSLKYHSVGLGIYSDQPGKYTSKNRLYGFYSYHLPIGHHSELSAGTAIGIYNYYLKDNPALVTGSATAPDGSIGIQYRYKQNTFVGFSIQQLFGTTLFPSKSAIRLKTNYIISARQNFKLSYQYLLKTGGYYRFLGSDLQDEVSIYALLNYIIQQSRFIGGVNYKGRFGLDAMLMYEFKLGKGFTRVGLSYNIKTKSVIENSSQFQLSLNYLIK